MKSVLSILAAVLAGVCLCRSSPAAEEPGRLSIYGHSWEAPHGFEPRALTERERELIREILAAGADFQALYVLDVVTGTVDALDQAGAKFGQFNVSCDSHAISLAVRPLCDELSLPVGLSLRTDPAGDQIAVWQGCSWIRRLTMFSPHMNSTDLLGLADYPALENLQLGWQGLRWGTGLTWRSTNAQPPVTITNDVVDALSRIGTLRRIMLLGCPVTATNLDHLQNLKALWIQNSELSRETLASCTRLSQIEELDLSGSALVQEEPIDWSALQNVKTLSLPAASLPLPDVLRLNSGLGELGRLEALSFSPLRGESWPDLSMIPRQVQRVEFFDVMLDGVSDLGFAGARLQAHRVLFERLLDSERFVLTEMHGAQDTNRRNCRIAGRQIETIRLQQQEYEPADFRIVRYPHWTVETGFADDAMISAVLFHGSTPQTQRAAQRLARLDLFVGSEPLGGGGIAFRDLAAVHLRWSDPLALPGDAADAVDQLVQIPLQKLVITSDEFPLERLAELGKIETLTSFELRRDGLSDEQLVPLQSWNQLKELTIHSPGSTFSKEVLELLSKSLPKCDLEITDASGQPLLWRKKPPAGVKLPTIEF